MSAEKHVTDIDPNLLVAELEIMQSQLWSLRTQARNIAENIERRVNQIDNLVDKVKESEDYT